MTPNGTVTVAYKFDGKHGEYPYAPLIQGSDGNLYGTASGGGQYGGGVAFEIMPDGAFVTVHSFPDPNVPGDGNTPYAGLIQAADGNFYGVSYAGGADNSGVIFEITSTGAYSIVYNLDGIDGSEPKPTPRQHTSGDIYGMTSGGGLSGLGVVYGFDIGLSPFIRLVSPYGKVGQTGGILGQGFIGTTGVSLNGLPVSFTVKSDTYITATVPAGATTGYVTVTTPSGMLTSNVPFHVIP
jgi:uncharacterized repeat protein (TIGR03803 family)